MKKQKIQSFGEAFNGKTPSKREQRSSGRPILKIRDIDEAGRFRGAFESFVDDTFYYKYAKKKLQTDDTIILNAAHNSDYVGSKNAFISDELNGVIATGEWLIVRVKDANSKYVNQYLKSPSGRKSLKNCVKGIHLYPKDVKRISVPLPPLGDQIRIAHLLGKVEGLIARRKQHLQHLDDLLKSVFLEMFGDPVRNEMGWMKRPLSELATVRIGPFGSLLHAEDYISGGIPLINPSHMVNGEIAIDESLTITEEKYHELSTYHLALNDVVVARRGEIGRCALVRNETKLLCGTGSMLVRVTGEYLPIMLQFMIYRTTLKNYLESQAKGVTMKNLNSSILEKMQVIVPPIDFQNQFATIVEKIEALKFCYQQSLTDLEALYGALSQKAFKGELDLSRVPIPAQHIINVSIGDQAIVPEPGVFPGMAAQVFQ